MNVNEIEKVMLKVENGAGKEARYFIESLHEKMKKEKSGRNDLQILLQYGDWIFGLCSYLLLTKKIDFSTLGFIEQIGIDIRDN